MRNIVTTLLLIILAAFSSCSGSETYLGAWKGTDANGDKYQFDFKPKNFSVIREDGDSLNFEYTQNSIKIKNSVKTYGITLKDGRVYNIYFPVAKDESKCLMTLENGTPVYTLSRTSYLSQNEIYNLVQ